ncbi:MAG: MBL fold metallo-hydrolase [Acidobacteriota bacterium]
MPHRYTHVDPDHRPHSASTVFRWAVLDRLAGRRDIADPGPGAPRVDVDSARLRTPADRPRITWLGHASFLVQMASRTLLVDPVLASRLGPLYRRYTAPGLGPSELPDLDVILVSHAHYDHFDTWTLKRLDPGAAAVVPLGMGRWFRRRGFAEVHELGWWDRVEVRGVEVTLVPARHWSRRGLFDVNDSLWGGFVCRAGGGGVYHGGDSAYCDAFVEIGRRFPDLDVALLPIGAYEPAWFMEHSHMNPEQAGRAFLDVGAKALVPMHWGTFQLTDESLRAPAERLRTWWRQHGPADRRLAVMAVGETFEPGEAQGNG